MRLCLSMRDAWARRASVHESLCCAVARQAAGLEDKAFIFSLIKDDRFKDRPREKRDCGFVCILFDQIMLKSPALTRRADVNSWNRAFSLALPSSHGGGGWTQRPRPHALWTSSRCLFPHSTKNSPISRWVDIQVIFGIFHLLRVIYRVHTSARDLTWLLSLLWQVGHYSDWLGRAKPRLCVRDIMPRITLGARCFVLFFAGALTSMMVTTLHIEHEILQFGR